jgi:hypothetical protein
MIRRTLVGLAILFLSATSNAYYFDGNNLMRWINAGYGQPTAPGGMLLGYIGGVVDARSQMWSETKSVCIPEGVPMSQLEAIVVKFLKDNPSDWNLPGDWLVSLAILDAFSCSKK